MAKILLINPPWVIGENKNLWKHVASLWPSLGLGYIAAVLEKNGHDVRYIDCSAEHFTVGDMDGVLENYRDVDYVGITATTPLIKNGLAIAALVKKKNPKIKTVFGGVHPSIFADEVLADANVDFVVIDEGEETMTELVSGKPLPDIAGLCYKIDGRIVKNIKRPLIKDLDTIPPPAYHLMPIDKYYPAIGSVRRSPAMILFATRGCPGRCTFCYRTFYGIVRRRSARNIVDEIKILQKNYGVKEVSFYDDTFTLFKDVVREFCEILKKEKIDLTWSCFTRVDHISEELLQTMKDGGCHLILFGVESADEGILTAINKRISLDKVRYAVSLARKIGIETRASFMFGNQGETEETIRKTIDFALELDPDEAQFNIATPYPGTELFTWASANGYITSRDWNDYSYSNVVFEMPGLKKDKLEHYYKLAHRKFYFRPKIILRRLFKIKSWLALKQEVRGVLALGGFIYGND
jgi:radical SAM superfamily enzyme YgiQ (UPF0313 family)